MKDSENSFNFTFYQGVFMEESLLGRILQIFLVIKFDFIICYYTKKYESQDYSRGARNASQ
jgi:hypothetical protein